MPKTSEPPRAAIYCRVASADPLRLERQEQALRLFALENGYADPVSYLDNGYSGLRFDRPAFSRLNADIQAGNIQAVLVKSVDRIGRGFIDVGNWIDGLEKKGVAFITADYPLNEMSALVFRQVIANCM